MLLRHVTASAGCAGSRCFRDGRSPEQVEHTLGEMAAPRVCGLALGYEDLNDYEQLRCDPVWVLLAGQREPEPFLAAFLAGAAYEMTPADADPRDLPGSTSASHAPLR